MFRFLLTAFGVALAAMSDAPVFPRGREPLAQVPPREEDSSRGYRNLTPAMEKMWEGFQAVRKTLHLEKNRSSASGLVDEGAIVPTPLVTSNTTLASLWLQRYRDGNSVAFMDITNSLTYQQWMFFLVHPPRIVGLMPSVPQPQTFQG